MQAVNDKLSILAILSMTVCQKKNRQACLAIFCVKRTQTSETRTGTDSQQWRLLASTGGDFWTAKCGKMEIGKRSGLVLLDEKIEWRTLWV